MRRRPRLVASCFAALLAALIALPRKARAEELPTPAEVWTAAAEAPQHPLASQQATHWCWAATVANAFGLSGHRVSQSRIVRALYGDVVNMRSGPAANVSSLLDRAWTDDEGGKFRAHLMGVFDAAAGRYELDGHALVGALRAGRPLIIGTTSHAMLLIGASYETTGEQGVRVVQATVFDPWPGVGERALRPDEMVAVALGGQLAFIADVAVSR
jgi:hypothetical protein